MVPQVLNVRNAVMETAWVRSWVLESLDSLGDWSMVSGINVPQKMSDTEAVSELLGGEEQAKVNQLVPKQIIRLVSRSVSANQDVLITDGVNVCFVWYGGRLRPFGIRPDKVRGLWVIGDWRLPNDNMLTAGYQILVHV